MGFSPDPFTRSFTLEKVNIYSGQTTQVARNQVGVILNIKNVICNPVINYQDRKEFITILRSNKGTLETECRM